MLEAFSVYYSIPFNHGGGNSQALDAISFYQLEMVGAVEMGPSHLTSLHAEVFLRPVTGRALLIRGPVVDVTLRFDQRCAAVFFSFPQHKCPPFFCLAGTEQKLQQQIFSGHSTHHDLPLLATGGWVFFFFALKRSLAA